MNLLIVDDEVLSIRGILMVLDWKKLGISEVFTAYNFLDATNQFKKNDIDILLTDIEMSNGTGLDLIRWLDDMGISCVKIILSGYPNFDYAREAIKYGAFEYLLKPIEDSVLENTIKKAIEFVKQNDREKSGVVKFPAADKNNTDSNLEKAQQYISENISSNIGRNDVSECVGLNPEYLSRLFKRHTGFSLSDYIKNERITTAQRLLDYTNLPISVISENVGYQTLSYFSTVFKNEIGMTPNEYRHRRDHQE